VGLLEESSFAAWSVVKPQSVKSGAAAIPMRARTRSGRSNARWSAIQPPIDEPISNMGPLVSRSSAASASSSHSASVPSSNRPPLEPVPE
jgi:hypothetical protein